MYLSTASLLILAGCLAAVLVFSTLYLLAILRRERSQCRRLLAREEFLTLERNALDETCARLRSERNDLLTENRDLYSRVAALETSLADARQQSAAQRDLLEMTRERMEKDFQILAERIFTRKSETLGSRHQEELTALLKPVREQLTDFRKKVEEVYDRDSRDRVSLGKEIEHLKKLNLQVSEDAVSLANALRGQSKVQGQWGEMILERVLESSGLRRDHEFRTQGGLRDKNGQTRFPDVLVRLPREREIVIDAKVSLRAYAQAARAKHPDEENRYLGEHVESLKRHVAGLAAKEYHLLEGVNSLDFVILFLPMDGALQAAITSDPDLLTWSMARKIVLASPSTLLAILRTVNHMWRQEEQTRNSLAIAKQAGSLYDKLVGLIEAFEEIGSRLHQTRDAWETARKRLVAGRGNLISRAEALKELGVQSSKTLPVCPADEENPFR
ncbi:MAG: DNA recombination protein RmuC [Desulfobulbus sp.]|nr:MAG: DNA recombination protein RmuC [Desulfobulbus sp.]